ncbi:MAG: RNA 2',3'-cyclic phosphodiesterase [Gammaproteobacteria bacterium]|nr:RNA 2',3'-cyclic phosphodiesterase [Gammaproteobacteria bacterium]MCP5136976.1 RNA 2',3'-cyclic phosphodiesterase [Gammaproteobacteria bacterium]
MFFALWPDDAVRLRIAMTAMKGFRDAGNGVRLVPAPNLHLTLAFLGPVPAERVDAVRDVAACVDVASGSLCLDASGGWRKPQVGWLAPGLVPDALAALERELWGGLVRLGWRRGQPEFRPHVTVVRKLRHPPAPFAFAPICWRYDEFVLCESVSTRAGVRYDIVDRWGRCRVPGSAISEPGGVE